MSNEPFSFKSQYKAGIVKNLQGGGGGRGDYDIKWYTPEEKLAIYPPITKEAKGAKKEGGSLQVPKEKGATKKVSPKASPKSSPKARKSSAQKKVLTKK